MRDKKLLRYAPRASTPRLITNCWRRTIKNSLME
jgi:hypothetical protein